ncbi:fatty acid desaturase [Amycolatopsis aidingensis]|uniref:fatty acid desaturase n=1 Tax=Amycolatopsis aidingensis TaxID=2842453 RepID=UPI001C0B81A8|nr:fatty acid desaturase [Amycolatopsis aidingensis]
MLPAVFALPLTLLTGKPHAGQRPFRITPTVHLVNAMLSVSSGLALSAGALAWTGWWLLLLLPGWAMTLHGIRNLRMMIFHQCAHRNMWGRRKLDALLGRVLSALLLIQHYDTYSAEHVRDHHALHHMTLRDPTVQAFLLTLRLRPGMTRRQMWRMAMAKTFSPGFHARFFVARICSYCSAATRIERTVFLCSVLTLAALVSWLGLWTFVLVAWLPPGTVFFQMSNVLRLCVKHTFPAAGVTERRGRDYFAGLTNAIFLGEAAPAPGLAWPKRMRAWARWWLRMAFVHFPARYLVLTGDTVCHDFHHRYPMSNNWANYIFAREADFTKGHPGWPPYRHVWGLAAGVNVVFDSLAAADATEYDPERLTAVNRRDLFLAFDD